MRDGGFSCIHAWGNCCELQPQAVQLAARLAARHSSTTLGLGVQLQRHTHPRPPLPWNLTLLRPHAQAPCPRLIAELPHLSGSAAGPTANPQQPRPNSPQFNQFNACGTCRGFQVLSSCPPPPSSTINSQTRLAASLFVTTYHQASLPLFLSSPR